MPSNVLKLVKCGCDFKPDSPEAAHSDLWAYRFSVEYKNRNGQTVYCDLALFASSLHLTGFYIHATFETLSNGIPVSYRPISCMPMEVRVARGVSLVCPTGSFPFTKTGVLVLINSDSAVQYDSIQIDSLW